jgi:hypothetical protein
MSSQDAYDFLNDGNEIIPRVIEAYRRGTPRRVALTTLTPETIQVMDFVFGTPTVRPRLERQNAMAPLVVRRTQDFFLERVDTPKNFECAICLDDEDKSEMAIHPQKCHVFHKACLNRWMNIKQYCPMCKADYDLWFM